MKGKNDKQKKKTKKRNHYLRNDAIIMMLSNQKNYVNYDNNDNNLNNYENRIADAILARRKSENYKQKRLKRHKKEEERY